MLTAWWNWLHFTVAGNSNLDSNYCLNGTLWYSTSHFSNKKKPHWNAASYLCYKLATTKANTYRHVAYLCLIAAWALKPHWATPWLDVMPGLSECNQTQKHPHFGAHKGTDQARLAAQDPRLTAWAPALSWMERPDEACQILMFLLFLTFINTARFPETLWLSSHSQIRGGGTSATSISI